MAEMSSSPSTNENRTWPAPCRGDVPDSVTFDQGRGLLIGLTGCTPEGAARALVSTAAQLGIAPTRAAEMLLELITTLPDPDSEAFVTNLERASLGSFTPTGGGGTATFRSRFSRRG
jgi:hypothetical protein